MEVDAFDLRYRSQRLTAEKTLKEAKGQWLYLQKLRIQRQKDTAPSLLQQQGREEDTDCCPVCYDTLGDQIGG